LGVGFLKFIRYTVCEGHFWGWGKNESSAVKILYCSISRIRYLPEDFVVSFTQQTATNCSQITADVPVYGKNSGIELRITRLWIRNPQNEQLLPLKLPALGCGIHWGIVILPSSWMRNPQKDCAHPTLHCVQSIQVITNSWMKNPIMVKFL
jgi:hypothetical protein